ncbi:phosphate acetyltransferase [Candidatus Desantisbacteria bacterium CG1_02_38_46]|uniref:Phosphate acetyltransferase n=1 Tax=Candidatus Desantisbacteria bacterium CG1_02_38_46 TaxID=1817893 RepID=A0A1J4S8T0_9BACT|nr:MAG: phosphate acetyltransferase [Candidatus Desantisbacteria bacterium CG1_02_38_46]
MDIIAKFKEKAKSKLKRIVLPETTDKRILDSAFQIKNEGFAIPVLVGNEAKIKEIASSLGVDVDGIETVDPASSLKLDEYAVVYSQKRTAEGITKDIALKLIRKNLFFGAMMVAQGDADGMVAGASTATSVIIQIFALAIGYAKGISTASSFFIMVIPEFQGEKDKILIYADAAVSIDPSAVQLAEIAVSSGRSAKNLLGMEPRIAMLSFSTKGSASHVIVDKVIEATKIAKEKEPAFFIDGEFQVDTALVQRVADKKLKEPSEVAGRANVLIFPDLNSGNISYKLTQYLAGAKAYGPFLQGFAKPVSDLSRGASVQDIVGAVAVVSGLDM